MAKNKEVIDGILEKLALISEASQDIFEDAKPTIIYELSDKDYKEVQDNFRDVDKKYNKFRIEISGVDFIIINSEKVEDKKVEEVTLMTKIKRLFSKSSKSPAKN